MEYGASSANWGRRARRQLVVSLVLATMLAAHTGCSGLIGRPGEPVKPKPSIKGTIKISGSGTCLPLLKVLQPDFNTLQPGVRLVFLPGVHSGGGIKGTAGGTLDAGSVSRKLTGDEKKLNLAYSCLSDDALAVAAYSGVGVTNITTAQLRDVYSGKTTNWKQLGGHDLPITVLDRNEDESAKIVFRQAVLGPRFKVFPKAVNLYYESDMVQGLINTPGSIGYLSYGFSKSEKLPIQVMALNGIEPSIANVSNGTYVMVRDLGIVWKKKPPAAVRAYVDYLRSSRAAKTMARYGYAPCQKK